MTGLCLLVGAAARWAHAAEPTKTRLELTWEAGADGCPDQADLARRVTERLGWQPFDETAERAIQGRVTRVGNRWRARLRVLGRDGTIVGQRELNTSGPDCASLADAVTLAIALTIDPEAAYRPSPPPPASPAAPATTPPSRAQAPPPCPPCAVRPAPVPPVRSVPPLAADEDRDLHGAVTARGALAVGLLPAVAGGIEIAADVVPARGWHLLAGMLWLPEVATDDEQFRFGITAGYLGGCYDALGWDGGGLGACASVQLGALHSVVSSAYPLDPGQEPWAAMTAGPRLTLRPLRPLLVELGIDAVVPLVRTEFWITHAEQQAFQPSPVGALGFVGAGVAIP